MGRLTVDGPHAVQFFVTCSLNERDTPEARERVRDRFLSFAHTANDYLQQTDKATGDPIMVGRPFVSDDGISFSVECGKVACRVHVHAIISCEGRGKVSWDLKRIRHDFPNTHWDFKYVRQPKSAAETMAAMTAYASKSLGTVRAARKLSIQEVASPAVLMQINATVIYVGTCADAYRRRREHEKEGYCGCMYIAKMESPADAETVADHFAVTTRKKRKGTTTVYVLTQASQPEQ